MPRRTSGYRLLPRARADLEEIWRYSFETWSMEQADDYISRLVEAFEAVADGSRIGRPADHIREGYLSLPVGSHLVFYRTVSAEIQIVRVLHQRMDFQRHL